jgi:hypothetical protein
MRGCLFTLVLGVVAIALLVGIGLPQAYGGVITGAVTAAGLQADDTTVTVASDPPTDLLGFRADRVRLQATDATFRDLRIGSLDLMLRDVAVLDRTARLVEGTLADVTVTSPAAGGEVTLEEIAIEGDAERVTASTVIRGAQAEALIARAVEQRTGAAPADVRLEAPDRLIVDVGVPVGGRLDVTDAGDLVVRVEDNPLGIEELVLLEGGSDLPIHLTSVRVTDAGNLRLAGDLAIDLLG